mmetsp:Transcript_36156/g.84748  ORF Transcript_36156/g.84748 Transcript_36156/m.84748 type:complete len:357 (-) Transcript_36156:231-1301(-)
MAGTAGFNQTLPTGAVVEPVASCMDVDQDEVMAVTLSMKQESLQQPSANQLMLPDSAMVRRPSITVTRPQPIQITDATPTDVASTAWRRTVCPLAPVRKGKAQPNSVTNTPMGSPMAIGTPANLWPSSRSSSKSMMSQTLSDASTRTEIVIPDAVRDVPATWQVRFLPGVQLRQGPTGSVELSNGGIMWPGVTPGGTPVNGVGSTPLNGVNLNNAFIASSPTSAMSRQSSIAVSAAGSPRMTGMCSNGSVFPADLTPIAPTGSPHTQAAGFFEGFEWVWGGGPPPARARSASEPNITSPTQKATIEAQQMQVQMEASQKARFEVPNMRPEWAEPRMTATLSSGSKPSTEWARHLGA